METDAASSSPLQAEQAPTTNFTSAFHSYPGMRVFRPSPIDLGQPKYPEFKTAKSRYEELQRLRPFLYGSYADDIVRSGLVPEGLMDNFFCFSCGLTLKNWKLWDCPYAEHKRHLEGRHCDHLSSVYHSSS